MTGWDALWDRRELPQSEGSTLAQLMAADGLDSGFAGMTEESWKLGVRYLVDQLELEPGSSIFEVGCGAGAFLYETERLGHTVAGIDRSPALIAKAEEVMPQGSFNVRDAAEMDRAPRADAVLSFGVFLYFRSEAYAETVVDLMIAKAHRVVGLFDLPDVATRDEDTLRREQLAGGADAYAARYAGLEHRYYDRESVANALGSRGLTGVRVEDQVIHGYGNSPYRFNAWGFLPS